MQNLSMISFNQNIIGNKKVSLSNCNDQKIVLMNTLNTRTRDGAELLHVSALKHRYPIIPKHHLQVVKTTTKPQPTLRRSSRVSTQIRRRRSTCIRRALPTQIKWVSSSIFFPASSKLSTHSHQHQLISIPSVFERKMCLITMWKLCVHYEYGIILW